MAYLFQSFCHTLPTLRHLNSQLDGVELCMPQVQRCHPINVIVIPRLTLQLNLEQIKQLMQHSKI